MPLPSPRGPFSDALLRTLCGADDPGMLVTRSARVSTADDLLTDDDAQLALYLMYELHYGGLGPDADVLEWHPDVLAARAQLERRLEAALREACPVQPCAPRELPRRLFDLAAGSSAPGTPSVPGFLARQATVTQVAEQLVLRSPYQLKEGDPQTWAIPRLRGRLCGHLAAFEMTSSLPAKRVVAGMQRLGLHQDAWEFFDEHIEADAVHEQVAAHDLCGALV